MSYNNNPFIYTHENEKILLDQSIENMIKSFIIFTIFAIIQEIMSGILVFVTHNYKGIQVMLFLGMIYSYHVFFVLDVIKESRRNYIDFTNFSSPDITVYNYINNEDLFHKTIKLSEEIGKVDAIKNETEILTITIAIMFAFNVIQFMIFLFK